MNRVTLVGNLTGEIKKERLKEFENGNKVAKMQLAVNRDYKNKEGEYEADFITLELWNKTIDFVQEYVTPTATVSIEGRLRVVRKGEGEDYKEFNSVVVDKISPIGKRSWKSSDSDSETKETKKEKVIEEDIEVPF